MASALVTDFHFAAPTEQFVHAHAAHGNEVHHYELQWESPRSDLGACHDMCLPLLFGTMDRAPTLAGADAEAAAMSEALQDAWIAFARSGDPSTRASVHGLHMTSAAGQRCCWAPTRGLSTGTGTTSWICGRAAIR